VPLLGVVRPESRLAAAASRNGRIGLIATPATVASGAYRRALAVAAPAAELHATASAELAPLIQEGAEVDERVVACVETACAPLKAAGVDTVILGCTHYPLVRPLLERTLGRGVAVVSAGEAMASEIEARLRAAGLENDPHRSGDYRFIASGDPRGPSRPRGAGRGGRPGMRSDGRAPGELREVTIDPGFVRTAAGSALISLGGTRVICTASLEDRVPRWMAGAGRGWASAEYGMLPASTGERKQREVARGRLDGRTVEIQRLIGRSLRGVIDFEGLGERTVWVDCDVLEADGGTRCAAITGGYVALELALRGLVEAGELASLPLTQSVAAVSCGIVEGQALLDLDYSEDSRAEVDMNVVMTGDGGLVEVQATAERTPLSRASLDELLALAATGVEELGAAQQAAVGAVR
jgi:ribonuclease PH